MVLRAGLVILALAGTVLSTYLFAVNDTSVAGFWHGLHLLADPSIPEAPHWSISAALTCIMLIGLVFGALYELLTKQESGTVHLPGLFKTMVESRSFWLAVLVAPFAFFLILSFKSGKAGSVEHFAFAFQNGFFVKTIIPSTTNSSAV